MKAACRIAALVALAMPAAAQAQSLRLPKFTACEVSAAAARAPLGLVRHSAPDPAIGFVSTTDTGVLLARHPRMSSYLTRKGPGGPWRLWLARDGWERPMVFVPGDARLVLRAPGAERAITPREKGDWSIWELDPEELLAAFPGQSSVAYALREQPSGSGMRLREHLPGKLDLARLRVVLDWAKVLDAGAAEGRLPCGAPTAPIPDAVNPAAYNECSVPGYAQGTQNVWGDGVRMVWQYRIEPGPRGYAYVNVELRGSTDAVEPVIPDPPAGGADPLDAQLWGALYADYFSLAQDRGLKSIDQRALRVRVEGDWGATDLSINQSGAWPRELMARIAASRADTVLIVFAPEGQELKRLVLPAGSIAKAKAEMRTGLRDLVRLVADPMTWCAPPYSIVVT